jgi:sirohydrochlorin cobaltochelatase
MVSLVGVVAVSADDVHREARDSTRMSKEAILLVAFGSTAVETQRVFDYIEVHVKQIWADIPTRWAYTSRVVRGKLAKTGKLVDSPEMALARLMEDGFTDVVILSLHTIPGIEFHELQRNAKLFEQMVGGLRRVVVALPLLASHLDLKRAAEGIIRHVPRERLPEDAVVLVGHGSKKHAADAIYTAMCAMVQELDPRVFLASVQGYPALEDILPKLQRLGAKRVFLMPFMSVAGEHARKDMAGEGPESWKSVLTRSGYETVPVLQGTAECPEILGIWLDHLREAIKQLREEG